MIRGKNCTRRRISPNSGVVGPQTCHNVLRAHLLPRFAIDDLGPYDAVVSRGRLSTALALLALAATPTNMSAAITYRIAIDPATPHVREPVTIVVATFAYVDPPATPAEPLPLEEFPWTFVAESPSGAVHEIGLQHAGASPNQWVASFAFDEAGRWEIGLDRRHLGTPIDPALGARLTVEVRGSDEPSAPVVIAVALFALIATALLYRRRPRSARR
jgi:hypothetical protein